MEDYLCLVYFFLIANLLRPLVLAEALQESQICYVLDGILFLYGIILTFLYCRLKVSVWGT